MSKTNFKCPKCGKKKIDKRFVGLNMNANIWDINLWLHGVDNANLMYSAGSRENDTRYDNYKAALSGFFCRKCDWKIPASTIEELWVWLYLNNMLTYRYPAEQKQAPEVLQTILAKGGVSEKYVENVKRGLAQVTNQAGPYTPPGYKP